MKNYYEILAVESDTSDEEIKAAYRKLVGKYHPDRNNAPDAERRTVEIIEAYKFLSDAEARSRYDAYLEEAALKTEEPANDEVVQERDPLLYKWMNAARVQAQSEMKHFRMDFEDALQTAGKDALEALGGYLFFALILGLVIVLFVGVSSL